MPYPYTQNAFIPMAYPAYPQQQNFYPPQVVQPQATQVVAQTPPIAQQATSPITTNIVWVENEAKVDEYPVSIGNTVLLITYDEKTAYKKSTDLSGKPLPMEIFDLIPRKKAEEKNSEDGFVTKDEFKTCMKNIEDKLKELAESEPEEMVMVPLKKRGRKPRVVVDTNAEVITDESSDDV